MDLSSIMSSISSGRLYTLARLALIMFHNSPRWTLATICGTMCADASRRSGVRGSICAPSARSYQCNGRRRASHLAGGTGASSLRLAELAHPGWPSQGAELPGSFGSLGQTWADRVASAAAHDALSLPGLCWDAAGCAFE